MISYLQAILLGALQGVTELFPVSSLGHSVILPRLLGWHIDQANNNFLLFLVVTHLATALVLLGFFFSDWMLIASGIARSLRTRRIAEDDTYARLGWLIIVASVPAGILGLLLEEKLKELFASPLIAATFLACNGLLLYGADTLRQRNAAQREVADKQDNKGGHAHDGAKKDTALARMPWAMAIRIGCAQCIALIPGFSRTGSTIAGGLATGLSHDNAARFSFLLATPIIFAAAALKLPELLTIQSGESMFGPLFVGALVSAGAAYSSIRFLTSYFETRTLKPFAAYCLAAGMIAVTLLLRHY